MLSARNLYLAGTALLTAAAATDSLVGALVTSGIALMVYAGFVVIGEAVS